MQEIGFGFNILKLIRVWFCTLIWTLLKTQPIIKIYIHRKDKHNNETLWFQFYFNPIEILVRNLNRVLTITCFTPTWALIPKRICQLPLNSIQPFFCGMEPSDTISYKSRQVYLSYCPVTRNMFTLSPCLTKYFLTVRVQVLKINPNLFFIVWTLFIVLWYNFMEIHSRIFNLFYHETKYFRKTWTRPYHYTASNVSGSTNRRLSFSCFSDT